jgi:polysaccharide export outer membrane protein
MHKRRAAVFMSLMLIAVLKAPASDQNTLLIAPGDLLHIQVADTPEMEQDARVTDHGMAPIIGIATPRPILDVLALAGGLTPTADRHILIERQGDQHPLTYYVSNDGKQAIEQQVMVNPGDTVLVVRAGIVYILGDVNRPGGYVMSNNESQLTLLQGLALAGGASRAAKQGHAHLIRKKPEGGYTDTEFSIGDVQKGKRPDLALMPGDVLYLPFSYGRNFVTSGATSIAASATGAAIYAIP